MPPELNATVELVDEGIGPVDLDAIQADLVGISAITGTAPRSYEIAAALRQRGMPVVLGGVHPTLLPAEAQLHADAVVTGYAEESWPRLLHADGRAEAYLATLVEGNAEAAGVLIDRARVHFPSLRRVGGLQTLALVLSRAGGRGPPGYPPQQQQWQAYQAPPRRSSASIWLALGAGVLTIVVVVFMMVGGGGGGSSVPAGGSPAKSSAGAAQASGMGFEFNVTYGLAVPGVAYTEAAGGDKVRYVVSSGVKTQSTVVIKPDGAYVWDSKWDGKVIKGNWEKTGDSGYPIVLKNAQEGKNWQVGPDSRKGAKPETILVWDGSIWYEGYPLK